MIRAEVGRALVVDDAPDLVAMITLLLEREGFEVHSAVDGEQAVELVRTLQPTLVVLDLMLPKLNGIEVCARLRSFSDAYVLMLTARTEEVDLLAGLAGGADDFMTKPFSSRELLARIRALLRRPRGRSSAHAVRAVQDLRIDVAAREVTRAGQPVELTRIEFDLLVALSATPDVTVDRTDLITAVWGPGWFGDTHVVDVHMANLRRKMGDDARAPRYVQTVRGVGFRLVGP